jgi:hypothetical protein
MTLFLSEVLTALYTYLFMFHTMNHYIEKKFSVKWLLIVQRVESEIHWLMYRIIQH